MKLQIAKLKLFRKINLRIGFIVFSILTILSLLIYFDFSTSLLFLWTMSYVSSIICYFIYLYLDYKLKETR